MNHKILLGVNIDHSATVRQARYRDHPSDRGGEVEPDPMDIALQAQRAGADSITIHLREDRRHVQDSDVIRTKDSIQIPLNLEMAATSEMSRFALKLLPHSIVLVPEGREEVTTEGGLNLLADESRLRHIIDAAKAEGIFVSLFIDADPEQIDAAIRFGTDAVELHTGKFGHAWGTSSYREELEVLKAGAKRAHEGGLFVNAGHGLNYTNIREARTIPWLHEMNIGHSIIARALSTGISEAVREMKVRIDGGP